MVVGVNHGGRPHADCPYQATALGLSSGVKEPLACQNNLSEKGHLFVVDTSSFMIETFRERVLATCPRYVWSLESF